MNSQSVQENVRAENPLGYESVSALLAKFAFPSIIAMLVSSLYNVVDQIFIGQSELGYLGNAATNVSFPLITICMAITLTIGIGSATRFSIYLGQKRETDAAKVVGNGVCLMLFCGLCYAAVVELLLAQLLTAFGSTKEVFAYAMQYARITVLGMPLLMLMNGMSNLARADGSPLYSMTCMLAGAILNTVLDPLFIFVFGWGIAGAAWATVMGQAVSLAIAVCYLRRFRRVDLRKEYFRLNFREALITAKMGMSQGLTQIALTFVQIVMNRSLVFYGAQSIYGSSIPLAVNGIVMKVNQIVLALIIGINQGMQPIVGFNYGAKKYARVKAVYFLAVRAELIITAVALCLFEFAPARILSLFGNGNELYMRFAVRFMRVFLVMLPLNGIQMISSNLFAAIGKAVKGAVLSLTRTVLFFIPIVLLMPLFFGLDGILYAAPIADVLAFTLVIVFITREMRQMR